MKQAQVEKGNCRPIKAWSMVLGSVLVMLVAVQCFATTWYFPGPATNAATLQFNAIGCGGWHSLGVQPNNTVVAWGDNNMGQTNVPSGLAAIAVTGGEAHSLAVKTDGTVAAWGDNSHGQSTVPPGLSGVTAIAAGASNSLALKSDGTVVAWGDNSFGQSTVPPGLNSVVAIADGGWHSLAVRSCGGVVAWGDNRSGESYVPGDLFNAVAVAAGQQHSLALRGDGTVVAWGDNSFGQTNVPAGLSGVTAIAAGAFHNLALKADGTVVAWGANNAGQSTVPVGLSNVVAIACGDAHSVARRSDGSIVAWGNNTYGQSMVPIVNTPDNLQGLVDETSAGDTILVAPGEYDLTNQLTITDAITLRSTGGARVTSFIAVNSIWGLWISNSLAVADGFTLGRNNGPGGPAGGVFLVGGTVQNCTFTNFTFDTLNGPGYPGKSVTMTGGTLSNCVVSYNHSPGGDGSVAIVYCSGGGLVTDCQILANTGSQECQADSAGVYLENSLMSNSVVTGVPDTAFTPGPALRAVNSTIVGCTISHNHVHDSGSGATLNNCLMDRCVIAFNSSGIYAVGGGIFETNSIIRDSLIVSNSIVPDEPLDSGSYTTRGGGVYMQGGALVNCTVAANTADYCPSNTANYTPVNAYGAGVYAESGGLTNCIIFDNFASGCSNAESEWYNAGSGVFDHCCTTPDPGGSKNIVQDPQFADATNGNFHLASKSHCLAAGVVQSWMTGALDLDGNPRMVDGAVDMGTYESQSDQTHIALQSAVIQNPQWTANGYAFAFSTQTNRTYSVQYSYSLSPAFWKPLTSVSGNGTMMHFTNQNLESSNCFYRVVAQ